MLQPPDLPRTPTLDLPTSAGRRCRLVAHPDQLGVVLRIRTPWVTVEWDAMPGAPVEYYRGISRGIVEGA